MSRTFSEILGWRDFVEPGIVGNFDGSLMTTVEVRGNDLTVESDEERLRVTSMVGKVCSLLGQSWTWHFDTFRTAQPRYQTPIANGPEVSRVVDGERQRSCLQAGTRFAMRHFLTFTQDTSSGVIGTLFSSSATTSVDARRRAEFKRAVERVLSALSRSVRVVRLGDDEIATYLKSTVSLRRQKVKAAANLPLSYCLPDQRFTRGRDGLATLGDHHIAVLSLTSLPDTTPQLLAELSKLQFEFRYCTRWVGMSKAAAKELMAKREEKALGNTSFVKDILLRKYDNWANKDKAQSNAPVRQRVDREELKAADQAAEAQETLSDRGWGWQFTMFSVWDRSRKACERKRSELESTLLGLGLVVRNESIEPIEPWLRSLPGNRQLWNPSLLGSKVVRRTFPINTRNLADLMPTSSLYGGKGEDRELSKSTGVSRSWIYTEDGYAFDSDDEGGAAHTIVFGRTGKAAKSTFVNHLGLSFFGWPNAQVFSLSKGRSELGPCLMSGGECYSLGSGNSTALQPLAFVDDPEEAVVAAEWLQTCIEQTPGEMVTAVRRAAVADVIRALATEPPRRRTLTNAVSWLSSQQPDLAAVLRPYTKLGIYGHIFDGDNAHGLQWAPWTMFDISALVDMKPEASGPAIANVMHRMFKRFDGRPTLVIADEIPDWGHAPGVERATVRILDTTRKNNVRALLVAQSPEQLPNKLPSLWSSIKTSVVSTVFGPEPKCREQADAYKAVGATAEHMDVIAGLDRGSYLHLTGGGAREFALNPGPLALAVAGSNNNACLRQFEQLKQRGLSGDEILQEWLRSQKLLQHARKLGLCSQMSEISQAAE